MVQLLVFLPGVAKRLADLMNADFYLVFTSIHEVMIHNVNISYPEDLEIVLRDTIQEATPEEDFLTTIKCTAIAEKPEIL